MMNYPKTAAEWWESVEDNWSDLISIMWDFIPLGDHQDIEGNILEKPLYLLVTKFKELRDPKLARYFNAAWAAAPDKPHIHNIPSWSVLCDLCSEEHVLEESQ